MGIKHLIFALIIASITASGNLILKIGAEKQSWFSSSILPPVNVFFLLGGALFGLSLLLYLYLLRDLPLFVAQTMIAFQYVAVMLVARWVLHEKMVTSDILGMILIVGGIFLVSHKASN